LLGRFLFSGEEAEKPLDGLSGGERRRLSLAVLVGAAKTPNVLILDEPTNHLDIESREALEDALRGFPGAILLVSHDRALLDAVGTRTVAVEDRALRSYEGGWPEYVRVRDERRAGTSTGVVLDIGVASSNGAAAAPSLAPAPAEAPTKPKGKPNKPKGPSKNRLTAQQQAERTVEEAEAAMRALEDELADPAAWATQYESAKSEARHTAARRAVEEAYTQLEALVD
jgi:ATP-binding cassette subfamily F protein 3